MQRGQLDRFAAATAAVGTRRFDAALLDAVAHLAPVDHLTILTYRPRDGLRTLAVASRVDLSAAQSLTRDYAASHHKLDPNFADLVGDAGRRRVLVRRHDPRRLQTRGYEDRFYRTVGIIDKIAYIWRAADTGYYANFYRTMRTGLFSSEDAAILADLARFITALIRLHAGRRTVQASLGGAGTELAEQMTALLSDRLTRREAQVVAGILKGLRTEGIAIELGLKPSSVITFRKRAYAKLGIATQAELFACCLRAMPAG